MLDRLTTSHGIVTTMTRPFNPHSDDAQANGYAAILAALNGDFDGLAILLDGMSASELRFMAQAAVVTAAMVIREGDAFDLRPERQPEVVENLRRILARQRAGE